MTQRVVQPCFSGAVARRLLQVFLCAVYFGILNWSYVRVQCVEQAYYGYRYQELPWACQLLIWTFVLVPAVWLRTRAQRPSDVCLWVLYLTAYVPAVFIPYHVLDRPWTSILPLSLSLCASLAGLNWGVRLRPLPLRGFRVSPRLVHASVLGMTLLLTLLAMVISGGRSWDFSLENVYDRRLDARMAVQAGALVAYGLAFLSGALAPLTIVLGFTKRNLWYIGAGVLGLLSLFAFAGAKTDLFAPAYLLAVYVLVRRHRSSFGTAVVAGMAGLVAFSVVQAEYFGQNALALYGVARVAHMPGLLSSYYWDFFSEHSPVYFGDGFLHWLWNSPYDLPTPRLIGEAYMWGSDTNANANIWASGFANLGYFGFAVVTAALGWILYLIDSMAAKGEFALIATMCGFFGLVWSNTALETSLLSNGIAVSLVIFYALMSPSAPGRNRLLPPAPNLSAKSRISFQP
jgi:hypothetical protein